MRLSQFCLSLAGFCGFGLGPRYVEHLSVSFCHGGRANNNNMGGGLACATNLSIATIRKLELGYISPRFSTTDVLRKALETAGIQFTEAEGVRRRQEDIKIYQGVQGCAAFLEDIIATSRKSGGELFAVGSSDLALSYLFGPEPRVYLENAVASQHLARAKIILTDAVDLPLSMPRLEYRFLSSNYIDPMPFCVYGDKYALVAARDNSIQKIVVVESVTAAKSSRRHFQSMWEKAICSMIIDADGNRGMQLSRCCGSIL